MCQVSARAPHVPLSPPEPSTGIIIYTHPSYVSAPSMPRRDEEEELESEFEPAEGEELRVRMPRRSEGEIFGIADQLLGASRIRVMCADGKTRMARIPGKMKKRMWIREGDLVIVRPWKFQDEKSDVVWRYTKTQASYLSRRRMLPKEIDVF